MNLRGRRLRILVIILPRFYLLNIRVKNLIKSQRANTTNTVNYPYIIQRIITSYFYIRHYLYRIRIRIITLTIIAIRVTIILITINNPLRI
jgi:hypothetical protein